MLRNRVKFNTRKLSRRKIPDCDQFNKQKWTKNAKTGRRGFSGRLKKEQGVALTRPYHRHYLMVLISLFPVIKSGRFQIPTRCPINLQTRVSTFVYLRGFPTLVLAAKVNVDYLVSGPAAIRHMSISFLRSEL